MICFTAGQKSKVESLQSMDIGGTVYAIEGLTKVGKCLW